MDKEKLRQVAKNAELMRSADEAIEKEQLEKKMVPGRRLFYLRKFSGKMSRRELSEKTGVSESTIKKYETGGMVAQGGTLAKLADFFGVPLEYFISENDVTDTDRQYVQNLQFYAFLLRIGVAEPEGETVIGGWHKKVTMHDIISAAGMAAAEAVEAVADDEDVLKYIGDRIGIVSADGKPVSARSIQIRLCTSTLSSLDGEPVASRMLQLLMSSRPDDEEPLNLDAHVDVICSVLCTCRAMTRDQYISVMRLLTPLASSYHEYLNH